MWSLQSRAEVKNEWRYTSAPHICLHGVDKEFLVNDLSDAQFFTMYLFLFLFLTLYMFRARCARNM
jgi:hypothetical protein